MLFKVTKQFDKGREAQERDFMERTLADKYIMECIANDMLFKVKTTYRLYDDLETLLKTYTQEEIEAAQMRSSQATGTTGQAGRSSSFSPTPFNTAPQPTSLPRSWVRDEDKDK